MLEFEGFMLGINGVVTFKKSTLPEALTTVPLERIVLETDSPYLAPVPNRGKRNESANVKDTLMKVAEIYQMDPEYVAQVTSVNALKVLESANKVRKVLNYINLQYLFKIKEGECFKKRKKRIHL